MTDNSQIPSPPGNSTSSFHVQNGGHIHLMGICGTAMASLAGILKNLKYHVTGSDQNVYPPMSTQLESLGIKIKEGYKKENLNPRPDLVIVGNVITRNHEEAAALLASDIPYTSLPKALGEFAIGSRSSIVIAGTHGKTTTTSMMAWTAQTCQMKPGFLIGGIPVNFGQSFQVSGGDFFVIEGDEYDTAFFDKVPKFIHYRPRYAILTSVEFDHADIYRDLAHVKESFSMLLERIPENGFLMAHRGEKNVVDVVQAAAQKTGFAKAIWYGSRDAKYFYDKVNFDSQGCSFDVLIDGKKHVRAQIPIFGNYNVENALSVWATAFELGWKEEKILEAFKTFKGVKRRQEIIGNPRNITVIEDFAHHPTAVKVTLEGVKQRFTKSKIFAVFEPRSATSRRNVFQKDYVEAFASAHVTVISQPFNAAVLKEEERLSSDQIVQDLKSRGQEAHVMATIDEIVEFLRQQASPGDVILLMSNGAFGGIYQKLLKALE